MSMLPQWYKEGYSTLSCQLSRAAQ